MPCSTPALTARLNCESKVAPLPTPLLLAWMYFFRAARLCGKHRQLRSFLK